MPGLLAVLLRKSPQREEPPTSVWLAQGRRIPDIPIGYVFLFMYGLERRVLVDIADQPDLALELVQIRAEMVELLRLYGDSGRSFSGYASQFLDVIDFLMLQAPTAAQPQLPALTESRWLVPTSLAGSAGRPGRRW